MTTTPKTTHLEPRLALRVTELAHRMNVTTSKAIRYIIDAHFAQKQASALIALIGMAACLALGAIAGSQYEASKDNPHPTQHAGARP